MKSIVFTIVWYQFEMQGEFLANSESIFFFNAQPSESFQSNQYRTFANVNSKEVIAKDIAAHFLLPLPNGRNSKS